MTFFSRFILIHRNGSLSCLLLWNVDSGHPLVPRRAPHVRQSCGCWCAATLIVVSWITYHVHVVRQSVTNKFACCARRVPLQRQRSACVSYWCPWTSSTVRSACKEIWKLLLPCGWSCVGQLPTGFAPYSVAAWRSLPQHTYELTVVFRECVTISRCRDMEGGKRKDELRGVLTRSARMRDLMKRMRTKR